MSEWLIYHNPQCSKSRAALQLLREKGVEPEVVEYLKTPLTENDLRKIIASLDKPAKSLIRQNEEQYKSLSINLNSSEDIIQTLIKYPRLLERPIVVRNQKAVIGRPTEEIEKLF